MLSLVCPMLADASLITVGATAGPGLRSLSDSSGADLASGNQVQIGTFDSGFNLATMAGDVAALQAAWNPFGSLEVRSFGPEAGRFSGSLSGDDSGFVGEQIYLFAFQTTASTAPDASWSNIQAYGIFTNYTSSDWIFPEGDDLTSRNILVSTSSVTDAHMGSVGVTSLGLGSAVPEVSPVWISGLILGVTTLLTRRRPSPTTGGNSRSNTLPR
jgi:hypothetical protein